MAPYVYKGTVFPSAPRKTAWKRKKTYLEPRRANFHLRSWSKGNLRPAFARMRKRRHYTRKVAVMSLNRKLPSGITNRIMRYVR